MALAAVTRGDIANYVNALFMVYILLIFVYILVNLLFSFGRAPAVLRGGPMRSRTSCATCASPT